MRAKKTPKSNCTYGRAEQVPNRGSVTNKTTKWNRLQMRCNALKLHNTSNTVEPKTTQGCTSERLLLPNYNLRPPLSPFSYTCKKSTMWFFCFTQLCSNHLRAGLVLFAGNVCTRNSQCEKVAVLLSPNKISSGEKLLQWDTGFSNQTCHWKHGSSFLRDLKAQEEK